jgi:hypothetical protein
VVCGKQKKKQNVLVENNLKNKKSMKATLSYNLNDPDDRMAHMRAVKSLDMASALFDITRNLKKQVEQVCNTNEDFKFFLGVSRMNFQKRSYLHKQ